MVTDTSRSHGGPVIGPGSEFDFFLIFFCDCENADLASFKDQDPFSSYLTVMELQLRPI